ncbi:MAG: polysaccharide pyruvyl transferase family protein [Salinibacter sp.]
MTRRIRKKEKTYKKSVLLMSPSKYPGSLGDEAMLIGACEWLQNKECTVGVLTDYDAEIPDYFQCFDETVRLRGAYRKGLSSSRRFIDIARSWDALGVFGADVIDGTYSEERALGMLMRIYEAQRAGMPSQLLGSSVKDRNISPLIKDMVGAIGEERLAFRDKGSRDRFAEATGLQCDVVADAAFLLRPRSTSNSEVKISRIKKHKENGRAVWGLNTNWRLFDEYVSRREYIKNLSGLAKAFEKRIGPSHLVLMPHDTRGGDRSDFSVSEDLYKRLREVGVSSTLIEKNIRSYEIKKICKEVDFVLSMRMHLAIAAMSVSCPVASISYQEKFDGLYDHFNIDGAVLKKKHIEDKNVISEFTLKKYKNRSKIKDKISENKNVVNKKAKKNFDFIFDEDYR